jgi:hypothetical protein
LAALTSAILLALNPAHIWLALTPLTELLNFTLLVTCLLWLVRYKSERRQPFLLLSLPPLVIATATRFESWLFGAALVVYFALDAVCSLLKRRRYHSWLEVAAIGAAAALFPVTWIFGNYLETGDGLYFLHANRSFDLKWYGDRKDYFAYWDTLFGIDPMATLLALPSIVTCLFKNRVSSPIRMYIYLTMGPFLLFALLQRGQVQPQGNYIRYLSQFLFLIYPVIGWLVVFAVSSILVKRSAVLACLCAVLIVITFIQVPDAFRFQNDPAVEGLRVGRRLRELRANNNPSRAEEAILIELNYWQYLGIHVGANDMSHIVYDRPLSFSLMNNSTSLLDKQTLLNCVEYYKVGYVVIKNPELLEIVAKTLHVLPLEKVGDYHIFRVDQALRSTRAIKTDACPLHVGKGY